LARSTAQIEAEIPVVAVELVDQNPQKYAKDISDKSGLIFLSLSNHSKASEADCSSRRRRG
jgi:hypothetical protein